MSSVGPGDSDTDSKHGEALLFTQPLLGVTPRSPGGGVRAKVAVRGRKHGLVQGRLSSRLRMRGPERVCRDQSLA